MNYHLIRYRNNWNDFWSAVHSLNRKAELIRLVQWAKRKRLTGPLKLYLTRLQQEENSIMRLRVRNPKMLTGARLMHFISNLVSPKPRYYPKGSARHYRQCKTKRNRK